MLLYSAVFFSLAALGGLTMLVLRLKNRPWPLSLAALHGLLAATGLVLLILHVLAAGFSGTLGMALTLFVLAALGGLVMIGMHLRKGPPVAGMILAHGFLALLALLLVWLHLRFAEP